MTDSSSAPINESICLITGGTGGIGKETARGLARRGATVVIVGRDAARGATAVADVQGSTGNDRVHFLLADLGSQASVRQLAEDVLARYDRLDVLLNNAGAVNMQRSVTVDGIETTFAVNHLAPFLLTDLLLPLLRRTAPARIVNVSSVAHRNARIQFDDLQGEKQYYGWNAYAQSKLANIMFTYELARRLGRSQLTVNCLHPGIVASGFGKNDPGFLRFALKIAAPLLTGPEKGAETSLFLATSPTVATKTGAYFAGCKERRSSRASYDTDVARRLWDVSAQMTGLA